MTCNASKTSFEMELCSSITNKVPTQGKKGKKATVVLAFQHNEISYYKPHAQLLTQLSSLRARK